VTTYLALLRGINVGGHKRVEMAALRQLATGLGLADARTLLQTGNLVFRAPGRPAAEIEEALESETRRRLGVTVDFVVRTARALTALVAANPFPSQARTDPAHLLVLFAKRPPEAASIAGLTAAIKDREIARAAAGHVYVYFPDGVGRSRLTPSLIDKSLATRVTARNWNTVLKLDAMARGRPPG
jgi:uncharacterized protein (DUF1697 family)